MLIVEQFGIIPKYRFGSFSHLPPRPGRPEGIGGQTRAIRKARPESMDTESTFVSESSSLLGAMAIGSGKRWWNLKEKFRRWNELSRIGGQRFEEEDGEDVLPMDLIHDGRQDKKLLDGTCGNDD